MKKMVEWLLMSFLRIVMWFRYRITIEGADKLNSETLNKPGGVLFLPNHPAYYVDPVLVPLAMWKKYPIRPMVVEYMYYTPILNWIMRFLNALPVPNFNSSSNSLKRRKTDQVFEEVVTGLDRDENFLIYPAGKVKHTQKEAIGGASGIHRILQERPDTNIVLVRIKGLWGSSFSRAIISSAPSLPHAVWYGFKVILKNLIFFTPRRHIIVSFEPAPADFPIHASRVELNKYFENWYNQPDGLCPAREPYPGDTLTLVSYSMWGEQYLPLYIQQNTDKEVDISNVPELVQDKVIDKLAQLSESDFHEIKPEMSLETDIGLDSIDLAELAAYIQDEFEIESIPLDELTTVKKAIAIAGKKVAMAEKKDDSVQNLTKWRMPRPHILATMPDGKVIPEVFLKVCDKYGKFAAVADDISGVLTYSQMKMRVVLLAEYIKRLPGEYIGILLPASVGANILILATQLAGKVPLMINWTIGPRHLDAVVKLSGVQTVLTTWSFIDKLDNVNLDGIDKMLIMLEEARREFTLTDKIKAYYRSRLSAEKLLKVFNVDLNPDSKAVILFTSGTESMPKGVPLTHNNLLSNLRPILDLVEFYEDDIIYGILPPFHAFGFTISGLLGPLMGVRVAFFPNPTDGKRIARGIEKWGITLICGAPTFLKGIFRSSQPSQIKTLRVCATGAEKAPPELFELVAQLGKKDVLIEGYGITECSPVLTFNPVSKAHKGVGIALPNVELCVVHPETYELLPQGQQGLILARGPNIFHGYLNPSINSPFVTVDGKDWYKTGDLGYLDEDGYLIIGGRLKRFIKVGGEMVSLTAIEDTLLHALMRTRTQAEAEEGGPLVAVCAREIPGEKTKIFLFTRIPLALDVVNQYLREAGFSNLVKVSLVTQLAEIPIMGSGKINYRLLESDYMPKTENQSQ